MKKVALLTVCLLLIPCLAFAYTVGTEGKLLLKVYGIKMAVAGPSVDLNVDAAVVDTATVGINARYAVDYAKAFPGGLFFSQDWSTVYKANVVANAPDKTKNFSYVFGVNNPDQKVIFSENVTLVFP